MCTKIWRLIFTAFDLQLHSKMSYRKVPATSLSPWMLGCVDCLGQWTKEMHKGDRKANQPTIEKGYRTPPFF